MGKMKDFLLSIDENEDNAQRKLESASKFETSFVTSEDDWNNYRDEEMVRDACEEEKANTTNTAPVKELILHEVCKAIAEFR